MAIPDPDGDGEIPFCWVEPTYKTECKTVIEIKVCTVRGATSPEEVEAALEKLSETTGDTYSIKDCEDLRATLEMYEITVAEHTAFTIPVLDFRGTPVGVDIRKVVELGITPRINTGIAHKDPGVGQVGAGLVRPPTSVFEDALVAFAGKYLNK